MAKEQNDNSAQTVKCLSAMDEVTIAIADKVELLIDNQMSIDQCKSDIILLIQHKAGGNVSEENKKLIEEHIEKLDSAFRSRSTKEKTKEVLINFTALCGTAIRIIGDAFLVVGAAQGVIEIVSEVIGWCKNNVMSYIEDANKPGIKPIKQSLFITKSSISDSTGILRTVTSVLGITVLVGAILHTVGHKLEQNYKNSNLLSSKMSPEESEKHKKQLIDEIAGKMPEERMRHIKSIKHTLNKLGSEKLELLKSVISKSKQRFLQKKAATTSKSPFSETVEGALNKENEQQKADDIKEPPLKKHRTDNEPQATWIEKEQQRRLSAVKKRERE